MSEDAWRSRIKDTADLFGWMYFHAIPGLKLDGRVRTTYEGDDGFPDCCMARGGLIVLAELKKDDPSSQATPGQLRWLAAAGQYGYLWRPADWPFVEDFLRYAGRP